MIIDIYYIIT